VAFIESGDPGPSRVLRRPKRRAGKTIEFATGQMPQRVTRKCVKRQQRDVRKQNQRTDSNSEFLQSQPPGKEKSFVRVVPQKQQKQDRQVQEIAMNVLQNKRKRRFALVAALSAFAYPARRWIEEKCPVVRFAIVVASRAKSQRSRENQQRR